MKFINILIFIGIMASAWAGYEYLGGLAKDDAMTTEEKTLQLIKHITPLAEAGDKQAQLDLARLYLPRDAAMSVKWINLAATNGHGKSQYYYGMMFETGQGVSLNLNTAILWYQRSAKFADDENAQYALGRLYNAGVGLAQDTNKALSWFRKSAKGGQPAGQYMVGRMFETGWGGKIDFIQSYAWYTLSNRQRTQALNTTPANDPEVALKRINKQMNDSQREKALDLIKDGVPVLSF